MVSALTTCAILTIVGVLSGIGTIRSIRVGSLSAPPSVREAVVAETFGGESRSH
jgi:hypothetical protein